MATMHQVTIPAGTTVIVEGVAYQLTADAQAQGATEWMPDRFFDPILREYVSLPKERRAARRGEFFATDDFGKQLATRFDSSVHPVGN